MQPAQKSITLIEQLFYLSKDERTLRNLAEAFGLKEEGSIRQNMERWLKGPFAHFFTGEKDHLDFGQQLVAIDMTSLLECRWSAGDWPWSWSARYH